MIPFFFVNLFEDLAENGIKLSIVVPTMQGLAVGLFRAFFSPDMGHLASCLQSFKAYASFETAVEITRIVPQILSPE